MSAAVAKAHQDWRQVPIPQMPPMPPLLQMKPLKAHVGLPLPTGAPLESPRLEESMPTDLTHSIMKALAALAPTPDTQKANVASSPADGAIDTNIAGGVHAENAADNADGNAGENENSPFEFLDPEPAESLQQRSPGSATQSSSSSATSSQCVDSFFAAAQTMWQTEDGGDASGEGVESDPYQ